MKFEELSKKTQKKVVEINKHHSMFIIASVSNAIGEADNEIEFEQLAVDSFNHLLVGIYEAYSKLTGNRVKPNILH